MMGLVGLVRAAGFSWLESIFGRPIRFDLGAPFLAEEFVKETGLRSLPAKHRASQAEEQSFHKPHLQFPGKTYSGN
jgi:hypothetical protein